MRYLIRSQDHSWGGLTADGSGVGLGTSARLIAGSMKTTKLPRIMIRLLPLLLAGVFALDANAQTELKQESRSPFSLGIEGGTTGFGPVLSYTVSPKLAFALSYDVLNVDFHDAKGYKSRYNGDVDLSHLAAVVDWYPMGGHFHLTTGAILYNHRVDITARTRHGETYEIGDHSYNNHELTSLTGKIDTGSVLAPYLGVGWTWHFGASGFSLITNVGLMFTRHYEVKLTAQGPITNDPTFVSDLSKEQDDLGDGMRIYPVAKVGVVYNF